MAELIFPNFVSNFSQYVPNFFPGRPELEVLLGPAEELLSHKRGEGTSQREPHIAI